MFWDQNPPKSMTNPSKSINLSESPKSGASLILQPKARMMRGTLGPNHPDNQDDGPHHPDNHDGAYTHESLCPGFLAGPYFSQKCHVPVILEASFGVLDSNLRKYLKSNKFNPEINRKELNGPSS